MLNISSDGLAFTDQFPAGVIGLDVTAAPVINYSVNAAGGRDRAVYREAGSSDRARLSGGRGQLPARACAAHVDLDLRHGSWHPGTVLDLGERIAPLTLYYASATQINAVLPTAHPA